MVQVQEATYIPNANGGEIQATVQVGNQQLASTWQLEQNSDLLPQLERLVMKVEQVTFVSGADGAEIRTTMNIGDRDFVSRIAVEGQDKDLKPLLDLLMAELSSRFLRNLEEALRSEGASQPQRQASRT